MKAAIRSDNPVLFFEHKQLYKTKMEIPDEEYVLPIGKADIKREGGDVTILAVGLMVQKALEAAQKLAAEGISCEVVDPRTLLPFDKETAYQSISKTHRCVIVEESNLRGGLGAEWAAMIQEELFDELDAPIKRVASLDVPLPYNLAWRPGGSESGEDCGGCKGALLSDDQKVRRHMPKAVSAGGKEI